ncbi:hypothetical protein M3J09_013602 [Ascochyta lentis]
MTQTGKCDTCRQRKVKCDEEKPQCGACSKKDRPCSYTYGRASALVVQDPNQLTKHGKSKVAPVVYTLEPFEDTSNSSSSKSSELRVSTQRKAESGSGTFQTLAPVSVAKLHPSKKISAQRKKALEIYLQRLQSEASLALIRPSSAESTLIARWVNMLGSAPADSRPLSILGTWIQSIPSRVGSNTMLDLAVEFLVDSHAVYWEDSYSKRQVASMTKSRALKKLQLAVSQTENHNTYDMVLATKLHYAAETLLGVDTMYHAIHAYGLAELLKSGGVSNVDDEHYWNLIDNTYVDDVNEAMLAGRASVFDNDYYLSMTFPPALTSNPMPITPVQRASISIMHVFVQCPRLNCLVRQAITYPESSGFLAAAVSLTEYMWQINLSAHVSELIQTSVTTIDQPVSLDMADLLPESLHFNSIQNMILCTRYWMLQNVLCGLTDTLHRHFPNETALSLLPGLERVQEVDIEAGVCLAESLAWAESVSEKLPLVPLRLHTPLQISIGPWHRMLRHTASLLPSDTAFDTDLEQHTSNNFARAVRMKRWLINECNRIHEQWDVSTVDERSLYEALDSMAGEEIPEWLPTRVRFEAEDGDMVLKLDYERSSGKNQDCFALCGDGAMSRLSESSSRGASISDTYTHELQDTANSATLTPRFSSSEENGSPENSVSTSPGPSDFLFKSGRNLCSTSGWWPASNTSAVYTNAEAEPAFGPCTASSWWPQTPKTSIVLLDSTHKTSAFQPKAERKAARTGVKFNNTKANGCMSPAWTSRNGSTEF